MSVEAEPLPAGSPFAGYAEPSQQPPFASYAAFAALLNAGLAGALLAARRAGHELPERVGAHDLALIGTASHKLSRLVAKDKVTVFARAPFTEFEERGGPAEIEEKPRGRGLRRAIGELVVCPYCLGLWAASGFHVGAPVRPRATRFTASIFAAQTISDFLQIAYKAAEQPASATAEPPRQTSSGRAACRMLAPTAPRPFGFRPRWLHLDLGGRQGDFARAAPSGNRGTERFQSTVAHGTSRRHELDGGLGAMTASTLAAPTAFRFRRRAEPRTRSRQAEQRLLSTITSAATWPRAKSSWSGTSRSRASWRFATAIPTSPSTTCFRSRPWA